MANTTHSSKNRSHQQHHQQFAPQSRAAWPPYQKLLISTPNGVRLQDARSQNTLVELDNVHSMSVATSSDAGCRVLVAHNNAIILRDHFKRKDTVYRLREPAVSNARFDMWLLLTEQQAEVSSVVFLPNPDEFLFWTKHSNIICCYSHTPVSYTHLTLPTKRIV